MICHMGDAEVPCAKAGTGSPSGHPDQAQMGHHRLGERTNKTGKGKEQDIHSKNVENTSFRAFNAIANTIALNYRSILNYFINRSTNASAESFNAKKSF